jgi:nitric oxide synthase-interacting protein
MEGNQAGQLPSFWIPSLTPAAKKTDLKRPDQHVYCPISGKHITMKDLLDVKFKLANDVDPNKRPLVAVRDRYVCAVTGDLLGNSVPCAVLRTSGNVVTMDCVNRLIKIDMTDPITGAKLTDADIIPMQRGGTGEKYSIFCKTGNFMLIFFQDILDQEYN